MANRASLPPEIADLGITGRDLEALITSLWSANSDRPGAPTDGEYRRMLYFIGCAGYWPTRKAAPQ